MEARLNDRRFDLAVADAAARLQFDKGEALIGLSKALSGKAEDAGKPKGKQTFGAALAARKGNRGDAA